VTITRRMPFDLPTFAAKREFLYHLTDRRNLNRICATGRLDCAAELLRLAGEPESVTIRRVAHREVPAAGEVVRLRDQKVLHQGAIEMCGGWSFPDFVRCLNEQVFFWAGTDCSPVRSGRRHFKHYKSEAPLVLRVKFDEVLKNNPGTSPRFSSCNSGSTRCQEGRKVPRGPDTFRDATSFPGRPEDVVEVVFRGSALLPPSTLLGSSLEGPWWPLGSQ
jgi:hypothetical protein